MNDTIAAISTSLGIGAIAIVRVSGKDAIKIVDKTSDKVIKEYPAEETLDMIAKVWELAGMFLDERG